MTAKLDGTNGLIQQYDYQVPTTGFSYTFAAGTTVLVMNPAGTLATGTITMPASPADGMTITFSSTKQVTALTVNGNTGQTVVSGTTKLVANQAATYVYRIASTSWYPVTTIVPATGSVVQVVSSTIVTSTSTSSTSFVTTGLSASITPASSTNKILAIHSDGGSRTSASGNAILTTLFRNGSNVISTGTSPFALSYLQSNAGVTAGATSFQYLDSPASSSSVTYAVYVASYNTAGTVVYNTTPFFSSLILMEVTA